MQITPNRVVAILTVIGGLCGAVVPAIANMDTRSTAGWIAGLAAAALAALSWLDGWKKYEARQGGPADVPDVEQPPPGGDYTPGEFGDTDVPHMPLGMQGDAT